MDTRPIEESEFDAVYDCAVQTFGSPASEEDREDSKRWIELDRTFTATNAGADVRLSAESIGSAYLGAPRISELAWAGRVDGDGGAVALLDAMMRWPEEPHCSVHF